MRLFVDTSGWIALFGDRDKYHKTASKSFQEVGKSKIDLITTDYVVDETLTNLQNFYGHHTATRFGRWVLNTTLVKVIHIDLDLWNRAWAMFQVYDDKKWAFTDCTSFIVMHELNLWQVFAFDHHFQQAGFQLWPGGLEQL